MRSYPRTRHYNPRPAAPGSGNNPVAANYLEFTRAISNAEMLTSFTIPIVVIAAAGAGKVIVPVDRWVLKLNFIGNGFTTHTAYRYEYTGPVGNLAPQNDYNGAFTQYCFDEFASINALLATDIENKGLQFRTLIGDPTNSAGGNSNVIISGRYKIIQL